LSERLGFDAVMLAALAAAGVVGVR